MSALQEYEIVLIDDEDRFGDEVDPLAIAEATGKVEAMQSTARGLGGEVSHLKTYQQNRPVLWHGGRMYVARRRRLRGAER